MESKKIYYSKFKTTAIFYSSVEHVVEIFEDDTFILTTPEGKQHQYLIINVNQEKNDMYFFLKNR